MNLKNKIEQIRYTRVFLFQYSQYCKILFRTVGRPDE